jgi:hypothetical protein
VLAVWSQGPSARYRRALERIGKDVEMLTVEARIGSGTRHVVFLARARS